MKVYRHPVALGFMVLGVVITGAGLFITPPADPNNWEAVPSNLRLAGAIFTGALAAAMTANYFGFRSKRQIFLDEPALYQKVMNYFWNGAVLTLGAIALGVIINAVAIASWCFALPASIGAYGLYLLAVRAMYWRALGDRDPDEVK